MPVRADFDRWEVFQLARERNYFRHRDAHRILRGFLQSRFKRPIHILDLGCGDAREIVSTATALNAASYVGVDTSLDMLSLARKELSALHCPWSLHQSNCLDFVRWRRSCVDVIWMGLLLHHFPYPSKLKLLAHARTLFWGGGCLLAHDPMLMEGESRSDYLRRLGRVCRHSWKAISSADKTMLHRHWSQYGRQDRFSTLAHKAFCAGLTRGEILYRDPSELFALTLFAV